MSWSTDDGLHEGYVVAEFGDGVRAHGMTGGGVPTDQVVVDVDYVGDARDGIPDVRFTSRPAAEVVGWRIMCDCRRPDSSAVVDQWASDLLVRVPSRTLEDLPQGRIFAPDEDVPDVDYRDDVTVLVQDRWRREHAEAHDALERVGRARSAAAHADREVDAAVAAARAAGASWEAIGRAAGMARQSAHARWGTP